MPSFKKFPIGPKFSPKDMCIVTGFDPGETTGWCVLGVTPARILGNHDLHHDLVIADYGQIDCVSSDVKGWEGTSIKHAGINMAGENNGIAEMLRIANLYVDAPVVVEDFIPDMSRMDQARHTLSPVRIMSGFSYGLHVSDGMRNQFYTSSRIFIQNRSLAKTHCTDERLTHWGLYDRMGGRHSRDACRHALYFLRDCAGKSTQAAYKRHLAWPHLFGDPADSDVETHKTIRKPREKKLGERI